MTHFSSLDLAKPILEAIAEEGYETPTPIQAKAIPPALEGRDLLGCAQTGTGKTAAFALPILHRLHSAQTDKSHRGNIKPRALILSPTRELALQIHESFDNYGRFTHLRQTAIFGGVKQHHQVRALQRGVDILVATPGRLMDLMEQRLVDLRQIEIFVLDEADRMLDMGFIDPIRQIAKCLPRERQTLLFSATMPQNIMHLADSLLRDPAKVSVKPVEATTRLIEQSVFMVQREEKLPLLEHLLSDPRVKRALVFTRTKHGADKVTRKLEKAGVTAIAIHGNKAQNQRQRALESFRSGRSRVLVATDVAARGLDVDNITHVFNFDIPREPEAYVHRIGRTGRAGSSGVAISFCAGEERGQLRSIERLTGLRLVPIGVPAEHRDESSQRARPPVGSSGHQPNRSSDNLDRHPQRSRRPASQRRTSGANPKRSAHGGSARPNSRSNQTANASGSSQSRSGSRPAGTANHKPSNKRTGGPRRR